MTILPPGPGEPRRPDGPRDPGDAWVVAADGTKYWGRFGAAGLLAYDPDRGILLQERVGWSHFGGTWGLPGGALHQGESALDGALRESNEEAGVPRAAVRPLAALTLDLGIWSYTTVVAFVTAPFDPVIADAESVSLRWVPLDEVAGLELHPGFGSAWSTLRPLLDARTTVVVDVANLVGSVPDGWWKDRRGATERTLSRLATFARTAATVSVDAPYGLQVLPRVVAVIEGDARAAADVDGIEVIRASGAGDDAIVDAAASCVARDGADSVVVVTSDRGLHARVRETGADVRPARFLLDQLPRD